MAHWRTLRWSSWLGWQIDSNWASPWLFALYVLVKPLAGALTLVCMYWAVRSAGHDSVPAGFLPFLYISNACFMLIGGVTLGMTNAVVTDRESYGMLKFIRISPARLPSYLIGRGLSRAAQAAVGSVLTLAVGWCVFPELRHALGNPSPVWLAMNLAVGLAMLLALGTILAGAVLNMARYGMFLSEGIAGLLYLLSGAVFPIDVLPPWMRSISMLLPSTYWLEGMRRALLGSSELSSAMSSWSPSSLAIALVVSAALLCLIARPFFQWCERRAWRLGRFDQVNGV